MSNIFNSAQYYDFRSRLYQTLKKSLECRIDELIETRTRLHPLDPSQDIVINTTHLIFSHEGQSLTLPIHMLDIPLESILNPKTLGECFTREEQEELLPLVPCHSLEGVRSALLTPGLHRSPLCDFERKLCSGYFTTYREKEEEIQGKLDQTRLKEIYHGILKTVKSRVERVIEEEECSSVDSLQELSGGEEQSEGSQGTETEEEISVVIDEEMEQKVFFHYDYSRVRGQEELLLAIDDGRKPLTLKQSAPYKPKNIEWVENYRRQEYMRYSNPTKPWIYSCEDGRKVTVAPVAKKQSIVAGKPRDHPMLKLERPACVTILTLVRDAAARLPNGVGTRADISDLLKESQYVNDELPEEKLSNIVSGALDRLHYMADACVKYDSEKKLWLYLHSDRNDQHPAWGEDGEEYTDKPKKKKNMYDQ